MATADDKGAKKKPKRPSFEEINEGFQKLRLEQRKLITKLSEIEIDLNEHKIVLDTIKDLDGDRKCFRLIGNVLCEKTVKDVTPMLRANIEQLTACAESLNEQVKKVGEEMIEYKEKHSIQFRFPSETIREEPETKAAAEPDQKDLRNKVVVSPL